MLKNENNIIPIALFAYNRANHIHNVLSNLNKCNLTDKTDIYIFVDGPKHNKDTKLIRDVIQVIDEFSSFKSKTVIKSDKNLGLAKSLKNGISELFQLTDKLIILEDDILVSKYFLEYMNKSLNIFEEQKEIGSVAGYIEPINLKSNEILFLSKGTSWGWGTWKHIWDNLNWDVDELIEKVKDKGIREFNFSNYPYFDMLKSQKDGRLDSWAILFYANCYINNLIHVTPSFSLTANIGFGKDATHCNSEDNFLSKNTLTDKVIAFQENTKLIPNKKIEKLIENKRYSYYSLKGILIKIRDKLMALRKHYWWK